MLVHLSWKNYHFCCIFFRNGSLHPEHLRLLLQTQEWWSRIEALEVMNFVI